VDTDKDRAADPATAEDKDEGGKKPEPEPEPELDKATQKRIAAVQRAEKASKQALAAERQKMAAERAEWEEQTRETRQKIGAFEKMLGALRTNPIGVLQALGVTEDRFEDMSKLLYAHSPRGKADPRARELAESGLKDREYRDELTTLRTEIKELKQSREKEQAEAAAERELNTRMGKITKTAKASTEAPLFAKFYAKSPEKAESQLLTITYELARKTGEFPDPEDVIAAFEKKRREDLEDLGIDVSAMLTSKTPIQPKQKDKAAAEQRPAQTLSNDQGTSSQVQPELTEEEERAKIVADLRKLRAQATA
jgi:hypothetical protein